jgi:tetratricopeptide (TPR) repeat protein
MKIPEIQHAVDVRQSLEDEKRQTTSLGAELRAASTSIATRPVALSSLSSRDIIQREIEITQSLRQSAKVILEKGPLFVEKIDRLSGRLQSAPECYLVAARLFRKFADEEAYAEIAEHYRQVAVLFEKLAARDSSHGATLRKQYDRAAIVELLKYVREQEQYLDRLEAALRVTQINADDMDDFIKQIAAYSKAFEDFQRNIRELNKVLGNLDLDPNAQQTARVTTDQGPSRYAPNESVSVSSLGNAAAPGGRFGVRFAQTAPLRTWQPATGPRQPFTLRCSAAAFRSERQELQQPPEIQIHATNDPLGGTPLTTSSWGAPPTDSNWTPPSRKTWTPTESVSRVGPRQQLN